MAISISERRELCSLPTQCIVSCLTYAGNSQTCFVCKLFAAITKEDNICMFNAWNKIPFLRSLILPHFLEAVVPFYREASNFNSCLKKDLALGIRYLQKSDDKITKYLKELRPWLAVIKEAEFYHPMRVVPSQLQYLCNLNRLRISTGLVTLNSSVGSLIHLKKLSLTHNALRDLPLGFMFLGQITELHLDHNAFSEVPRVVCYLRKLRIFTITHNQIDRFPLESPVWQDLTFVDFSYNNCKKMPEPLSYCGSLRFIFARYNRIRIKPPPNFYPVAQVIDLDGNPIMDARIRKKLKPPAIAERGCRVKPSRAADHTSRYAKVAESRSTQ